MKSKPVYKNVCIIVLPIFQIDLKINKIEIFLQLTLSVQVQIESLFHYFVDKHENNSHFLCFPTRKTPLSTITVLRLSAFSI